MSLIYPIYLAFQTLSWLARQWARGGVGVRWDARRLPMAIPAPRTASFHCGLRNEPLTAERAQTKGCGWSCGEVVGPDVQRLWRGRSFCTRTQSGRNVLLFGELLCAQKSTHTQGCVCEVVKKQWCSFPPREEERETDIKGPCKGEAELLLTH